MRSATIIIDQNNIYTYISAKIQTPIYHRIHFGQVNLFSDVTIIHCTPVYTYVCKILCKILASIK